MRLSLIPIALSLAALGSAQNPPKKASHVALTRIKQPEKALRFEVIIPARRADVWQAFSTSAGLDTWLWQDCTVDLREGGGWIVHYPMGMTGGGTILSFRDGYQMVLHALAPERFPEVRRVGTTATFDFEEDDDGTRVTLTQTGWRDGEEWDNAYEYLAAGNAQMLEQLYTRFARGPLRWK